MTPARTWRRSLAHKLARASLLLGLFGGAVATQAGGCMSFDTGLEGEILLSTQVVDWRDEVIYQVLVDRFADGDQGNNFGVNRSAMGKYHGGDWKGLEDQLGYLEELGVTTLWISPIIKNVDTDAGFDGYHGYWAQDLTQLNPHFGDLADLRSLVFAAHQRGMKVIVDIVTNHMGQLFYYDINMNGEPDERVSGNGTSSQVRYINEYDPDFDPRGIQAFTSLGEAGPAPIIFVYDPPTNHMPPMPEILQDPRAYNRKGRTYNFEVPEQLLQGDFPGGLKDIDTRLCGPRDGLAIKETMVDVYARWVELTDIDGFRIDTVKHVEDEFWRYFTQKLRQRLDAKGKKNFLMFGEVFDGRDELNGRFTKTDVPPADVLEYENRCVSDGRPLNGDQLDSVFYFPQHFQAIRDVFQNGQSTARIQRLWAERPSNWGTGIPELGVGVPPATIPINFIDNHDVPRFLWDANGTTREQLRLAVTFVYTAQGIPCLYYGTEQDFRGGNDPANREDLWPTGFPTTGDTFKHIQKVSAVRRQSAAIRRGDIAVTWASDRQDDEEDASVFAYERRGGDAGDDYALVVLNAHRTKESSTRFEGSAMAVAVPPGTVLRDALGSGFEVTVGGDGTAVVTLPPVTGVVLVR